VYVRSFSVLIVLLCVLCFLCFNVFLCRPSDFLSSCFILYRRYGPRCLKYNSSAVAEKGDRLATIGMGRKWGGVAVGGWVPTESPSNTMWPGPRPTTWPQL